MTSGVYIRTAWHRQKISIATKEAMQQLEIKQKVKIGLKEYYSHQENREKVSIATKNAMKDKLLRERMSKNRKLFFTNGGTVWHKGKHLPAALRQQISSKMSIIMKDRWTQPDWINKMKTCTKIKISATWPEVRIAAILEFFGIPFETQAALIGTPDFLINNNICIFCDGDYWHNRPGSKEHDALITSTLLNNGYNVLRFWEHDINDDELLFEIGSQIKELQQIEKENEKLW